jgi:uridine phosphorylase
VVASPLLTDKHYQDPSVFAPDALLREARRQQGLPRCDIPSVCLLDPDGDLVSGLERRGVPTHPGWACYHTSMVDLPIGGTTVGVVGYAVGGPFAVLVAEQLFASGCRLLISVTSAGQLAEIGPTPYFILLDRAWRDEGTSHHYLPPSDYASLRPELEPLARAILERDPSVFRGPGWTTDAPYRETAAAIAAARARGLLAVEMEAASLYAFATAKARDVICFARVTNRMATVGDDFEKGEDNGNEAVLRLLATILDIRRG